MTLKANFQAQLKRKATSASAPSAIVTVICLIGHRSTPPSQGGARRY
jgi:hypothetical protein